MSSATPRNGLTPIQEVKTKEEFGILDIEYNSDEDLQQTFVCEICFCKFDDQQSYEIHKVSHNKLTCQYCNRQFKRRCDIFRHLQHCSFKQNHFKDENITEEIQQEKDVKEIQNKRNRRKKSEIIADHFCDICSKGFTRKHDMLKHKSSQHKISENYKEPPKKNLDLLNRCKILSNDGKQYYKCETCNKLIHLSYNFIRHQSIHSGIRPFYCHICGKNYRMSSTLTRHIRELHYRIKNYSCDTCGRKFAAKGSLEDHKNIHKSDRPFICDVCGKSFKQKSCLHIHKLFHSKVFRFSCNVCGKKYHRARDLKVHNWIHTGHRPYSCKVCGSMFRLSQDLKRHAKVHIKVDSDWVCNDCGATFTQQRSLIIHIKMHKKDFVKDENNVHSE